MTAQEFIKDSNFLNDIFTDEFNRSILSDKFIEFAKLHCGEQQKEILNQVELVTDIDVKHDGPVAKISINNDSILNAYPLENIK